MDERFILVDKHLSEGGGGHMEPDDQGDWVRYSDLAAALAENERLTKERDEAKSMLADAERDMRQRAADLCDCACMDGIGDKIRAIGDEILALPLKHADREGGV